MRPVSQQDPDFPCGVYSPPRQTDKTDKTKLMRAVKCDTNTCTTCGSSEGDCISRTPVLEGKPVCVDRDLFELKKQIDRQQLNRRPFRFRNIDEILPLARGGYDNETHAPDKQHPCEETQKQGAQHYNTLPQEPGIVGSESTKTHAHYE